MTGKESFEHDYDVYEAYGTGRFSRADAVEAMVRRGGSNEAGEVAQAGVAWRPFSRLTERAPGWSRVMAR